MININKEYKTRDGQDVSLYKVCLDDCPVLLGYIGEKRFIWDLQGNFENVFVESNLDLVEVVETEAKDTSAMKIDMDKKYKTRDGQDVRIIRINAETWDNNWPVVGFIGEEEEYARLWTSEGKNDTMGESDLDLIEVVETEAKDTSAIKIDINKKYKTRDGQDVRVIDNNYSDGWPVKGYIGEKDGADLWTSEGKYDLERESDLDLVEVIETATPPKSRKRDMVNNPIHYGTGDIECIDYIQDFLTEEEYIGYLRGNIAKYLHRWRYKNGLEDLKKSEWYGAKLIKLMENK